MTVKMCAAKRVVPEFCGLSHIRSFNRLYISLISSTFASFRNTLYSRTYVLFHLYIPGPLNQRYLTRHGAFQPSLSPRSWNPGIELEPWDLGELLKSMVSAARGKARAPLILEYAPQIWSREQLRLCYRLFMNPDVTQRIIHHRPSIAEFSPARHSSNLSVW